MAGKGKSPMLIHGSTVLPVTMVYIAASLVKKHGIGSQLGDFPTELGQQVGT